MKFVVAFALVAIGIVISQPSHSQSLFYADCAGSTASASPAQFSPLLPNQEAQIFFVATQAGFAGMSCQDLKSTIEAAQIIGMALLPVSVALRTPGVREEIAASLVTYGLTLANPAILGVTVIGAVGVVTIYFVMKQSLKECEELERQKFKDDLLRQIKATYPGIGGENVPLEIQQEDAA